MICGLYTQSLLASASAVPSSEPASAPAASDRDRRPPDDARARAWSLALVALRQAAQCCAIVARGGPSSGLGKAPDLNSLQVRL
jgi:hypothetical protein